MCTTSASKFLFALPCVMLIMLGSASLSSGVHAGDFAAAEATKTPAPTTPPKTPTALVAFAHAWRTLKSYNATLTIFEREGAQTQNMVFDYSFTKPSSVTTRVVEGANKGARLAWDGGSTVVVRRGGGLLSMFKKTVSLHDPLVTTIRGSTVDELGFGAILAHSQQPGVLSQTGGGVIDGAATEAVTLIPTHPAFDARLTREVIEISKKTHLPTRVLGYEGSILVRKIDFANIHLVL